MTENTTQVAPYDDLDAQDDAMEALSRALEQRLLAIEAEVQTAIDKGWPDLNDEKDSDPFDWIVHAVAERMRDKHSQDYARRKLLAASIDFDRSPIGMTDSEAVRFVEAQERRERRAQKRLGTSRSR